MSSRWTATEGSDLSVSSVVVIYYHPHDVFINVITESESSKNHTELSPGSPNETDTILLIMWVHTVCCTVL